LISAISFPNPAGELTVLPPKPLAGFKGPTGFKRLTSKGVEGMRGGGEEEGNTGGERKVLEGGKEEKR